MAEADPALLVELEAEVGAGHPDRACEAALTILTAHGSPFDVLHAAARGTSSRLVPGSREPPHDLAALASAAGLQPILGDRNRALAVLQAVALAASGPKNPDAIPPPILVRGDVSHLGRSALLAARRGDLAEAESLFLGIVKEGAERRQAGDMLFRAALEDLGDSGHKLTVVVQAWRLAEALRFRDARLLLRPAVRYLVRGERDRGHSESMLAVLGREWVDLEALAGNARPLGDGDRETLAAVLAAVSPEACVEGMLSLLRDGIAPTSLADGIVVETAKRALVAEGASLEPAHGLLFAHAARFVLTFSRTGERGYAVFLAALRCRSPAPRLPIVRVSETDTEEATLRTIQEEVEAQRPAGAVAHTRGYLSRGFSPKRLVETLAGLAVMDSSLANEGHPLALAEACASAYAATNAPELLMALAKLLAASPRDDAAATAWSARLGL
ncbi:MAG TPA: hypothetical protein VI999_02375 [Thermoplasmata archaeon]|nr:hypothetical protein [Thermoplasmata archaeon]